MMPLPASSKIGLAVIAVMALAPSPAADRTFMDESGKAMSRMMAAMDARPTGDVDADFVNMMEPHHRGAIDMAVLELRYGRNAQLRRIAQEIIVDQQQEIAAMRLALGQPLPPSTPAPTQVGRGRTAAPSMMHMHEQGD